MKKIETFFEETISSSLDLFDSTDMMNFAEAYYAYRLKEAVKDPSKLDGFDEFWTKYHEKTNKPKTDRDAAIKYWLKMTQKEKIAAIDNIGKYCLSVIMQGGTLKYAKKARTYLADKNYNDEFESANAPSYSIGQAKSIEDIH